MNEMILFITGALGALLTFVVAHDLKQGVVRASAGLSLIVGLFFYAFPTLASIELSNEIPLVFFGASFVGMMGSHLVRHKLLILLGGAIFSAVYLMSSDIFIGHGGKLGTAACLSSLIIYGFGALIKRLQSS